MPNTVALRIPSLQECLHSGRFGAVCAQRWTMSITLLYASRSCPPIMPHLSQFVLLLINMLETSPRSGGGDVLHVTEHFKLWKWPHCDEGIANRIDRRSQM